MNGILWNIDGSIYRIVDIPSGMAGNPGAKWDLSNLHGGFCATAINEKIIIQEKKGLTIPF